MYFSDFDLIYMNYSDAPLFTGFMFLEYLCFAKNTNIRCGPEKVYGDTLMQREPNTKAKQLATRHTIF